MKKGVLALFGFSTAPSTYTLRSYANLYQIPVFSLSHQPSKYDEIIKNELVIETENELQNSPKIETSKKSTYRIKKNADEYEYTDIAETPVEEIIEEFQVNMFPDMIPLLVSLMKYNRWKMVYYIYNHEEGIQIKTAQPKMKRKQNKKTNLNILLSTL